MLISGGIRCGVFVLALLIAVPLAATGSVSAQETAPAEAVPPVDAIREAHALLGALGYAPGSASSGDWSDSFARAYRAFLRDAGLPASETLTPRGLRSLREVARMEGVSTGTGSPLERAPSSASDDLHRAVMAGDIDGVQALLSGGASADGRDGQGWTPLMHAANKGYVLLVEVLLRAGATPDIRAPDGATALFIAVMNGHPEAIALLMRAGASVSIRGPRGLTASEAARLLYGDDEGQRPVPDDAEVHALLAGMTWDDAVKAAVADRQGERDAAAIEASLSLDREARARVQRRLSTLGFSPGPADGVFGRRTRLAISTWQEAEGFSGTGYLTREQANVLVADEEKERAEQERVAREKAEREAREKAERERAERERVKREQEAREEAQREQAERKRKAKADSERKAEELFRSALSTAERVDDDDFRAWALKDIAMVHAERGRVRDALLIVDRMDSNDYFRRAVALAAIAKAQAKAGNALDAAETNSNAFSLAQRISRSGSRNAALRDIAVMQAEAGSVQNALSTLERIGSREYSARALALAAIAEAKARAGNVGDAVKTLSSALSVAQRIDIDQRVYALTAIADAQVRAGNAGDAAKTISNALSVAERIKSDTIPARAYALSAIAVAQAKVGDAQGAAETFSNALSIVNRWDRSEYSVRVGALSEIALAQAKTGDAQGAAETISNALSIVERIHLYFRGMHLAEIAIAQAKTGNSKDAAETISKAHSIAQRSPVTLVHFRVSVGQAIVASALLDNL